MGRYIDPHNQGLGFGLPIGGGMPSLPSMDDMPSADDLIGGARARAEGAVSDLRSRAEGAVSDMRARAEGAVADARGRAEGMLNQARGSLPSGASVPSFGLPSGGGLPAPRTGGGLSIGNRRAAREVIELYPEKPKPKSIPKAVAKGKPKLDLSRFLVGRNLNVGKVLSRPRTLQVTAKHAGLLTDPALRADLKRAVHAQESAGQGTPEEGKGVRTAVIVGGVLAVMATIFLLAQKD